MIYQGISAHTRYVEPVPVWMRENVLKPAPPETGSNRFEV